MYSSDASRALGFAETTVDSFDFLTSELGFRRVLTTSNIVQYESDRVYVEVYHDPKSLEMGVVVGLLDDSTRVDGIITAASSRAVIGRPIAEFQFTLDEIARLLHGVEPTAVLQPYANTSEDIQKYVPPLAEGLRKFRRPLLTGDKESFLLLANKRSEDAQRFTHRVELSQTREKAEWAWKKKDFSAVAKLYQTMEQDLTPAERKRVLYAKKQPGVHGE